ncbi:eCIS core domain-containing protein [Spirosoma foliorum]|uniref:DUF4157 domain-containing protein n=1 Tax=Spirosoma foliorum TaxID=2710596 RepID=A0A7G5H5G6_9BACT|nr:DUF4157 domain-containing protein [Spirosoma foliorum]QMW06358.1 DUF4157 domain-containing protein [Spirosoma foliorum]
MKSFNRPSKITAKPAIVQRKSQPTKGLIDNRPTAVIQRKLQHVANASPRVLQAKFGKGLPDQLKANLEAQSGFSLDDVQVHYNSSKPAEVGALAYAQGSDIYLGPGQEKHLAHEAWHVVQQKQGRVRPTMQLKGGVGVNDNVGLEQEADRMGQRSALPMQRKSSYSQSNADRQAAEVSQLKSKGWQKSSQVIQRAIEIEGVVYEKPKQRELINEIQLNLPHYGYTVTKKLLLETVKGLEGKTDLAGPFGSLDDFFEKAIALGLTEARIKTNSNTHRPKNLGIRPAFIPVINEIRTSTRNEFQEEAETNEKIVLAARHVIPSHLLGHAAEKLEADLESMQDWIKKTLNKLEKKDPILIGKLGEEKTSNKQECKRLIWKILHNHLGNLWVGDSLDNTAIGFLSGTIEKNIKTLCKSDNPLRDIDTVFTGTEGKSGLAEQMESIKNIIKVAFEASIKEHQELSEVYKKLEYNEDELKEILENELQADLTEVWDQIESDPASIGDFKDAEDFLNKFRNNPSLDLFTDFLDHNFQGSILDQQNTDKFKVQASTPKKGMKTPYNIMRTPESKKTQLEMPGAPKIQREVPRIGPDGKGIKYNNVNL